MKSKQKSDNIDETNYLIQIRKIFLQSLQRFLIIESVKLNKDKIFSKLHEKKKICLMNIQSTKYIDHNIFIHYYKENFQYIYL